MFVDVGGKVKILAIVFCIIGIIASVILGLITFIGGRIIIGLLIIALGSIFSWLSCLSLFAIGQSAENTDNILYRLEKLENKRNNDNQTVKAEATQSEYHKKLQEAAQKSDESSWWCSCGAKNSKDSKECVNCYKPKP